MDYFLFDFSGVQFHYTMSQKFAFHFRIGFATKIKMKTYL